MTTLLVIVWLILFALTIMLLAVRLKRTTHSRFELNRLKDEATLRRERLLGCLFALRRVVVLACVAAGSIVTVSVFAGWSALVLPVMLGVAIFIARVRIVSRLANKLFNRYEPLLLRYIEKNAWLGVFMLPGDHVPNDQKLDSIEHLQHLVESSAVLSDEQLRIVRHGLQWHQTPVSEVMIPRDHIVSVKHSELLGPLVLDDLHKSGHSQFPVTKNGIDNVVGLLDITESLEVTSARESQKVEDRMSSRVVRVSAHDPLPQALELLQKSKQHMVVVTDDEGKTVGLVTLADITGSLLGKTGVK